MANWTINNLSSQKGKLFLVTGANSGTGFATSKALAQKDAKVIMAVRNVMKGNEAASMIKKDIPNADVNVMLLDLEDLESIRKFTTSFIQKYNQLNVLINNAGIANPNERKESKQGFESHFGTNHLGHFALTGQLLPLLKATEGSRIVTVASFVPKNSKSTIKWNDLQHTKNFDGMTAYGQSKLANIMFALELQEKLKKSDCNTISVVVNPGFNKSGMQRDMTFIQKLMTSIVAQSPEMGMLPILRAATDPNVKGGEFYGPLKMKEMKGYPELTQPPTPALLVEDRQKLWHLSEQMTHTVYDFS